MHTRMRTHVPFMHAHTCGMHARMCGMHSRRFAHTHEQVNEYKYEIERLTRELQACLSTHVHAHLCAQIDAHAHTHGARAAGLPMHACVHVSCTCRCPMRAGWQDVKRRYFEQKRREQLAVGGEMGQKGYPIQQKSNGPRFTGGGFSLGA